MTKQDDPAAPSSPLEALEKSLASEIHVIRRDVGGRIGPVSVALDAYRRAVEESRVRDFSRAHSLRQPPGAGLSAEVAAHNLLAAVRALPELARSQPESDVESQRRSDSERTSARGSGGERSRGASRSTEEHHEQPTPRSVRPLSDALPHVAAACADRRLVVVGALRGRKRPLPEPLDGATEWVDTSDGGPRATAYLPQRIRDGRVFGVIICDQAVLHQHAEPLVDAARKAGVPVGFAAKGGAASVARALEAIEAQLGDSAGVQP